MAQFFFDRPNIHNHPNYFDFPQKTKICPSPCPRFIPRLSLNLHSIPTADESSIINMSAPGARVALALPQ